MASSSYPVAGQPVIETQYEQLIGRATQDGVYGSPSDPAPVTANGVGTRVVRITAGTRARLRGFVYNAGSSAIELALAANTSGQDRIDLIVLRLSRNTWRVTEAVVQGVPGQGMPAFRQDGEGDGPASVWEIPLAAVTVVSGATTLAAGTVTRRCWYLGGNGQMMCTPTTRPPHSPHRVAYETTTGQLIMSTGATWVTLYDAAEAALAAASGWSTPGSTARVRRRTGVVHMQLDLSRAGTSLGAGVASNLTTLPDGFRPSTAITVSAALVSGGGDTARISISPSGLVRLEYSGGFGPTSAMRLSTCWLL